MSAPNSPSFQEIIMRLQAYWAEHGCMIWQPYSEKVGAGTMNPATVLRVLGPEPWNVAYSEPSFRADDGRYGENPNRMQMHTQYQVILKPDPGNPQELYLGSLDAIDIDRQMCIRDSKGAHLAQGVHMGNFGEIKNSYLGPGTKMGHFSYLGDATVGRDVNIGAGTITCNFDGVNKHPTVIADGAFIGSDTLLVAPVTLGEGARTGAGSVVTHDVPAGELVLGVPARPRLRSDVPQA